MQGFFPQPVSDLRDVVEVMVTEKPKEANEE